MARKRKTKAPITHSSNAKPRPLDSAKPKSTRTLIRRFHVLLKRRAVLEKQRSVGSSGAARDELADIEAEMESMGGLEAYQNMSAIGQGKDRGGGSETVLIEWMKELGMANEKAKGSERLQLLEVGALKPDNYAPCSSWIACTPIDLRSRHPDIREQDFLKLDMESNIGKWDVVSLSLVVNFVPDAKDRGKMLSIAYDILRPKGGLLFLVLPTPCVCNSRYMTSEHLVSLCAHLGFTLIRDRGKPGGKVGYWLFDRTNRNVDTSRAHATFTKKTVLREGSDRNNFSILL